MKLRGVGSGTIKIITIQIDGEGGQAMYEFIMNEKCHQIIDEKVYGSSMGDMKVVIKYEDTSVRYKKK